MANLNPTKAKKRVSPILISFLASGVFLVVVALAVAVYRSNGSNDTNAIAQDASAYAGTTYEPPVELDDFVMAASTGVDMSLSDIKGQYILLFFGFTHCPDVCPTTLAIFRQVKDLLGDYSSDVIFLFISVDSPRDTPEVIATYLRNFDPDFIGMSGDDETLQAIAAPFGLFYERNNAESQSNYSVDHTGRSYVIDREGRLRVSYAYGTEAEIITDGLRELMQQDGD
mgnify:CR=1 FL=1